MLRVLTYHRIAEPEETALLHPRMVSATPAVFARQMQHLARHYHPVGLDAVLAAWDGGVALPKGAVLVTFDDAYRDFLTTAWPILRAERVPVALFVPTAHATLPRRAFWWDRLHASVTTTSRTSFEHPRFGCMDLTDAPRRSAALRALQTTIKSLPHEAGMALVDEITTMLGEKSLAMPATCDWDELRRLEREGVALGAHTRTHPLLTRLSPSAVRDEVAGSLADLRRETVAALPVFAYPAGAHDPAVVEIVRQCGVRLAFTQVDGHSTPSRDDALQICRTNITRKSTLPVFQMRLWSWMARVDRWRHRPRALPSLAR